MAEVKKIATRESYGNALKELGARNPRVVAIDADLAGSTKTAVFRNAFPDRHFNWTASSFPRDTVLPACMPCWQ